MRPACGGNRPGHSRTRRAPSSCCRRGGRAGPAGSRVGPTARSYGRSKEAGRASPARARERRYALTSEVALHRAGRTEADLPDQAGRRSRARSSRSRNASWSASDSPTRGAGRRMSRACSRSRSSQPVWVSTSCLTRLSAGSDRRSTSRRASQTVGDAGDVGGVAVQAGGQLAHRDRPDHLLERRRLGGREATVDRGRLEMGAEPAHHLEQQVHDRADSLGSPCERALLTGHRADPVAVRRLMSQYLIYP
jgi:hypothetical protein